MLNNINGIEDVKALSVEQLPQLCTDIRQYLLDTIPHTGGHLSSNLGVVELTVALHYIFNDCDKLLWDVGHQSYIHKILTGRKQELQSIRSQGGISGFTDPSESVYDVAISGHASTAISTAVGVAKARDIVGEKHNVVAILGDGALTGGLSYEGLNNVQGTNMLIVLNDNNMSIDGNVGGLSKAISRIRVGRYYKRKQRAKAVLNKIPLLGKPIYNCWQAIKRTLKINLVHTTYFDHYGIKYIGIIDGNDIKQLVYYLSKIKDNIHEPTLLHCITQKGRGYAEAEKDPAKYHNISAGVSDKLSSHVVGDELCALAQNNDKIVAITASMTEGVGLGAFQEQFPDRFYDVGIAEGHAVTFAGGMASAGLRPYVCVYSTFLQRGYDNIIHDVSIANLPVVFLIDRAGFVGSDGKTHQGLYDLSFLSSIPNMTIWTPYSYSQLEDMIAQSAVHDGPLAIRYSKLLADRQCHFDGKWVIFGEDSPVKILAVGSNMVDNALISQQTLLQEGINCQVVVVTTVKPLDDAYLDTLSQGDIIVTVEENMLNGGFGSQLRTKLSNVECAICSMGVTDCHVAHATVTQQIDACHLTAEDISNNVKKLIAGI